ncbi:MAG: protein kinase [Polyangiales bacterium]
MNASIPQQPPQGAGAPPMLGGFRLLELLGRGGMGEVWRAEREGPGGYRRRAAVKRILPRFQADPTLRARFLSEARINARLEHPNITQVLDFGESPEPYLALEYIEGTTVARVLKVCAEAQQRLPHAVAAFILAEVATGLDYAHRRKDDAGNPLLIVHRDVSPQNVLISTEGGVKISDFGIARAADNQLRTQQGIAVGKLAYMAPEQASGGTVDWRADVFALGVLLWETLLVRPLIPRNDSNAAIQLLLSGRFEPPSRVDPRIPPQLDAAVMEALQVDPNRRTQSAGILAQQLRGYLHAAAPGFDGSALVRVVAPLVPDVAWQAPTQATPAVHPSLGEVAEPATRMAAEPLARPTRPATMAPPTRPGAPQAPTPQAPTPQGFAPQPPPASQGFAPQARAPGLRAAGLRAAARRVRRARAGHGRSAARTWVRRADAGRRDGRAADAADGPRGAGGRADAGDGGVAARAARGLHGNAPRAQRTGPARGARGGARERGGAVGAARPPEACVGEVDHLRDRRDHGGHRRRRLRVAHALGHRAPNATRDRPRGRRREHRRRRRA